MHASARPVNKTRQTYTVPGTALGCMGLSTHVATCSTIPAPPSDNNARHVWLLQHVDLPPPSPQQVLNELEVDFPCVPVPAQPPACHTSAGRCTTCIQQQNACYTASRHADLLFELCPSVALYILLLPGPGTSNAQNRPVEAEHLPLRVNERPFKSAHRLHINTQPKHCTITIAPSSAAFAGLDVAAHGITSTPTCRPETRGTDIHQRSQHPHNVQC